MSLAVQKLLSIRAELRLPTVDVSGARAILAESEEAIITRVDLVELPAWNIALATDTRRELRLLAVACRNLAEGKPTTFDPDDIIRRIYGAQRPFLKGTWFGRSWNCGRKTVIRLCEEETLCCLPFDGKTKWSRGRNGTPAITWASAIAFLNSRRIK